MHIRTDVNSIARSPLRLPSRYRNAVAESLRITAGDQEQLNATLNQVSLNQVCAYLTQIVIEGACHG
jgi:hypothetical protein